MKIKIKRLHPDLQIPKYAHPGDAGMDIFSLEEITLKPGKRHHFKTGFALEMPEGYVSLIWDKSGLASKNGITSFGGVIEYTYRGEYGVVLYNAGDEDFHIGSGDKIAQLLIQKIETAEIEEVAELSDSKRGEGGFGSTGK